MLAYILRSLMQGIVVMLAVAVAGVPELISMPDLLPPMTHKISLALMLFYFGSR